ncbi:MAG: Type 1 glutamine amidotransferase-like domain-containing protein [Clostridiales bacterium]|jgi:dipeptidase E|nr:Type 1 glutamine amidotransferase-like domain-containing protein [Clostridiales bacterium]
MRLFLASFFSGVADAFPAFVHDECAGKKVIFIPTASLTEKVTFYVGTDKIALEKLGMAVEELEISTAPKDEISRKISGADYVFISGGNTFFLLQELRRTETDKLIVEHIQKGKLYIGASAGSMILSKNIEYVKYMDNPADAPDCNDNFTALSVVDFSIVPHCTNVPFKKAAEKIIAAYSDTLDLRPISNNQAITVDGDNVETITVETKKKGKKQP